MQKKTKQAVWLNMLENKVEFFKKQKKKKMKKEPMFELLHLFFVCFFGFLNNTNSKY